MTGAKKFTSVLVFIVACAPVSTQEPRFVDLILTPNRTGDKARVCCVIRTAEITARGVTVRQLIEAAYRRHAFDRREVIGGLAWLDEERYDFTGIVASDHVYDRSGFPAQTFAVLRAWVDRHVHVRAESRERAVYTLVSLGMSGPGLVKSAADCGAQMRAMTNREPITGRPCGASPYPGRFMARGITMADLASLITPWVDRPVVDRTGLSGTFDVDVEGVEVKPAGPFGPSLRPSDTKQSIFEHIQTQLGLKLQPVTAPIEVLVIERAERPTGGAR